MATLLVLQKVALLIRSLLKLDCSLRSSLVRVFCPDQTPLKEQSESGLHLQCRLINGCPNSKSFMVCEVTDMSGNLLIDITYSNLHIDISSESQYEIKTVCYSLTIYRRMVLTPVIQPTSVVF